MVPYGCPGVSISEAAAAWSRGQDLSSGGSRQRGRAEIYGVGRQCVEGRIGQPDSVKVLFHTISGVCGKGPRSTPSSATAWAARQLTFGSVRNGKVCPSETSPYLGPRRPVFDPEPAFKIGSTNGREVRDSKRLLCEGEANVLVDLRHLSGLGGLLPAKMEIRAPRSS
jgi:hypothetical protein